jgi:alpha-tubulin suppressor-like RCC1 family protein
MLKRVLLLSIVAVVACGGADSTSPDATPAPTGAGMHALVTPDATGSVDASPSKTPSIVVLDAANQGKPGIRVTFRVVSGGGRITDSVKTTDANGRAALGSWTLGPAPVDNIVEAAADGQTSVRFTVAAQWARHLATNALGACAVKGDSVYCWGDNTHQELGANFAPVTTPTPIVSLLAIIRTPVELSGSFGNHMCAIVSTRAGYCWGRNDYGQSGFGLRPNTTGIPPVQIARGWSTMSPGRITTCGVDTVGNGLCWGANQHGEIGNPGIIMSLTAANQGPALVIAPTQLRTISAGWLHACGIGVNNTAYCWGYNLEGELGLGTADSNHTLAAPIVSSEKFSTIAAGARHTCALTVDGRALCWGQNTTGQLGDGTRTSRLIPTPVAGNLRFASIFIGAFFISAPPPDFPSPPLAASVEQTCAITTDGKPYCWGWNGWGQLGDGTLEDRLVPTPVAGNLTVSGMALGESSSCAMRGTRVWCWGGNASGQLGDGTTTRRTEPVEVKLP